MTSKRQNLKAGDKVVCNGFPGTVVKVCEWESGLVEVRLERGTVCVSDDAFTIQKIS